MAAIGIPLTTVLGTIVGVARLSTNLLVRSAAGLYVETLRNLPPLLVIVFVNSAVFLELPRIGDPIDVGGFLVLSNRELAAASPVAGDQLGRTRSSSRRRWSSRSSCGGTAPRRARSPARRTTACSGRAAPVVVGVVGGYVLLDAPVTLSHPEAVGRGISGGVALSIGYGAVVTGLVLYTSSHVAEIVRGSVQAVDRGRPKPPRRSGCRPPSGCASSCCPRRSASPSPR